MKGTNIRMIEFKEPDYQKFRDFIPYDYIWKFGFEKSETSDLISVLHQNVYITFELKDVQCMILNDKDSHMSIHTNHGMIIIYKSGMVLTQLFKPIN